MYRLVRCNSCSYVSLANPPDPASLSFHYDNSYHRAISTAGSGRNHWDWRSTLFSKIKPSGGALLDVGCSSGSFLMTMMEGPWRLHGIEMEASTAKMVRERTGADVFVGDALDATFAEGSFDVITAFDLLEHVYDPRAFLEKVHFWLKPGGVFFTLLPNIDSWESRMLRGYWYGLELPRHISHFPPKSLRHLMTSLDFTEVSVKTGVATYIERSMDYVRCATLEKLGLVSHSAMRPRRPRAAPLENSP